MTHHRKRHNARRRRKLKEPIGIVRIFRQHGGPKGYSVVSLKADAGILELVCEGGFIESFNLKDIRIWEMKPRHHTGQGVSQLDAYDAG